MSGCKCVWTTEQECAPSCPLRALETELAEAKARSAGLEAAIHSWAEPSDEVKNLRGCLPDAAAKYWRAESDVDAEPPDSDEDHHRYGAAYIMVSERFSKGDLANLTYYLLTRAEAAESRLRAIEGLPEKWRNIVDDGSCAATYFAAADELQAALREGVKP